jgi:hypothetical protein
MADLRGKGREERETCWREQVRSCESSGLPISGYCRRHGIALSQYHWWKRELKRRDSERGVPRSGFAEVQMVSVAAALSPLLEVIVANGRRIGVHPGFDASTLAAMVQVLEGLPC